jgi:cutinase
MSSGVRNRNARIVFSCFVAFLMTAAIIKLGSSPLTDPPTRPPFVKTKCADLVVLGLRGSGQPSTGNAGVGEEVFKSIQNMATRLHTRSDTTVRVEAVDYRAARAATFVAYKAGVENGKRLLGAQYAKLLQECRASTFAFVGFSQGAQAVHEFSYNLSADRSRNLVLVGMIADPRKNPNDSITAWSYADKATTGQGNLGAGPKFTSHTRRIAVTFCVAADEVCNGPGVAGANAAAVTHKTFYEEADTVRSTGYRLDAILRRGGDG